MRKRPSVQGLATIAVLLCFLSIFPSPVFPCMVCETLKSPWIVLTFSPDGKILASSNAYIRQGRKQRWPRTVELWHIPSLKLWKRLPEGQRSCALAFSPDGKILAVGRKRDNCVSLWKLPEGRRVAQLKSPIPKSRFSEYVRSLAFSPDGKLLAVGTRNGLVHLYRLPQGKLLGSLGPILISEEGRPLRHDLTVVSLAFSPDGKKLAVLLEQGDVLQLWRVPEGQLIWQRKQDVVCFQVAFAKRGKEIVGAGSHLLRCNAADGKVIAVQRLFQFQSLPGGISADGEWVAVWEFGGEVKVYRSSDFKEVWRSSVPGRKLKLTLRGWAQKIEQRWGIKATRWLDFSLPFAFGFAFSPDKRWLALGFDDGSIRLWKIR